VIPPFPVYLFDIDGTLVDSAADIVGAIQEVLAANGRPTAADFDFLKSSIGHHLSDPFGDIFPGYNSSRSTSSFASTASSIWRAATD